MKIERYESPNHGSRGGIKPDMIVVHVSEGYYKSGIEWLCSPKAAASTHFFVSKEGHVAKLVNLNRAAWGNATTYKNAQDLKFYKRSKNPLVNSRPYSANRYTISIECEGFFKTNGGKLTELQEAALIKLIARIIRRVKKIYEIDIPVDTTHIARHCELTPDWKPNCGRGIDTARICEKVKERLEKLEAEA
jgi:N-acetyl-anhydromuramyl-L-alanine amidase AmpD